jgi:gliding motility-associated-like protein
VWFLCTSFAPPQTFPPCLSGIVNDYTPVLGFGCDSSTLEVGPLTGFSAGDKVLLIQMQVPQVDLSNSPAFGTLLNTNCIGNYEFNRIQSVSGNIIQLQFALTKPYDLSGKVQLVRVPELDSATVCGLTCLPWNGTIGGVLALDVKNQITMTGNVDVSERGFRGGQVEMNNVPWVFGEQQYFYGPVPAQAAQKGEGIVLIPLDFSFGRGRAGNGGGGGNAHNGGGGGGANAGAGGDGGLEITFPFVQPTPNTNGIGGQKYFENQTDKVLLGGGGGAGHANELLGSSGGSGGGIVFLLANTLETNNFRILANGEDVFGGTERNDGQGGGGGGGTVVLQVGSIVGNLTCELSGGRGGSNPYTPQNQIHGPGGGGGGGKLLLVQNSPNVTPVLQGGINGVSSLNFTNGAMPGESGRLLTGFSIPEGSEPAQTGSANLLFDLTLPDCSGTASGAISILQSSAQAFQLNGGPWQADSVFVGLSAGTYQIGLQFAGNCTFDTIAVLSVPPPAQDSLLTLTNANCLNLGSLLVTAVSGTAPVEFQLNGGPWQSSGLFTDLPASTYTLTLRDAAGCTSSSLHTISAPPPLLDSLVLLNDATCVLGGSLAFEAVSGTGPFEFQLNGGPWQSSGLFSDLPASTYTLTLRDAAGCTTTSVYTISAPPPLLDSLVSLSNATCVLGGSVAFEAVSGTGPFEFQLNGGPWQTSGLFADLPASTYTLTLRDAAGCTTTSLHTITAPPPLLDSLVLLIDATCVLGGSLAFEAVSGTGPFEFQLNGGPWQTSGLFADLPASTYTLTLRDAAGCTSTSLHTISAPPPPSDSLISLNDATCVLGGSLAFEAVSGTGPFEFQLNGGPWQISGLFTDLPASTYTLTLWDAAGCTSSSLHMISAPPPPSDSLISLNDATCVLGGSLAFEAVSGTGPFEFQLNGGPWQTSGIFSDLPASTYTLTLRDAAGCISTSLYTIAPPPPVQDSLLALVNADCFEGGLVEFTAVSGSAPFEFQLNGGPWQSSGLFLDLPASLYTLTLRDAAGCTTATPFLIEESEPLLLQLDSLGDLDCTHPSGFLAVSASGGVGEYSYRLEPGSILDAGGMFSGLLAGVYSVIVSDSVGCETILIDLEIEDLTDSVITREVVTIYEGGSFQLPDGRNTSRPGTYAFLYETVDGCDSLHLIEVLVLKRNFYVPNVFGPNDSGRNDFLTVYADGSLEIVELLEVYDRWGELIYRQENLLPNDEQNGWDGRFRGRIMNPGVYVWQARLRFVDGVLLEISGDVTIHR